VPRLSIVTAFLNEAENLPLFRRRVEAAAKRLATSAGYDFDYEVVLVDDHSTDAGSAFAKNWAAEDPRVQYLRLSRNFGSHAALAAGLAHCRGDCAVLLAADLQDPPETIGPLYERWLTGHEVVWAVRESRDGDSAATRFFAAIYYRLMQRMASRDIPAQGAGFLLIDRKVIDAYNAISEKHTNFAFVITLLGFRQSNISFIKEARQAGRSKWTLGKKVKVFVDSVISFSVAPVRLASLFGLLLAAAGFIYAAVVVVGRLAGWVSAGTGFAALMTVLLVGQGAILAMLGVLGEYLWRTFDQVRGRPRYVIQEHIACPFPDTVESRVERPAA
jgi:dolichol-phosphate mannosyltransferase